MNPQLDSNTGLIDNLQASSISHNSYIRKSCKSFPFAKTTPISNTHHKRFSSSTNLLIKESYLDKINSTEEKKSTIDSWTTLDLTPKQSFTQRKISIQRLFKDSVEFSRVVTESSTYSQNDGYVLGLNNNNNKSEDIRFAYIQKLIAQGVWNPNEQKFFQHTLIIFDWDDTLFATTFLFPNSNNPNGEESVSLTPKEIQRMKKIQKLVIGLLEKSIKKGDVFIVTNAAPGWVEYSASIYYPSIFPILQKVRVISARGEYESEYPLNPRMWKIEAFNAIVKNIDYDQITNIICAGDSPIEMEASKNIAARFSRVCIKTIKFKQFPNLKELVMQLQTVSKQFDFIVSSIKNRWTITIEKIQK